MKYESEILKVIYQDATEMFKVGAITESEMREFDELCLSNMKVLAKSIKQIKEGKGVEHELIEA